MKLLCENGMPTIIGGGFDSRSFLSTERYAFYYRNTRIAINITDESPLKINCRPWETMLCNALLIDHEVAGTSRFYTPGEDYVTFSTYADLEEKVLYYLQHDDERRTIAWSGHQKTWERYSPEKAWTYILDEADRIAGSNSRS